VCVWCVCVMCLCVCVGGVCVFVFAAVGIQHAMSMRHIVICGQPDSTRLFHIIS